MRTLFRAKQPYADLLRKCAQDYEISTPAYPVRFIEKMNSNRGSIAMLSGFGMDVDGLERRNPVIVGLGDSVTAGHFESITPKTREEFERHLAMSQELEMKGLGKLPIEITDARESYLEKFRQRLIDKYEQTSVSVINAGISGDTLISMSQRAERDVIRYQPDLVLINGVLNWEERLGTTEDYKAILKNLVQRIKAETEADIVLLTPNGDVKNESAWGVLLTEVLGIECPEPTTLERVVAVRQVAEEEEVCLADVYAVWERAQDAGCPWKELLANEVNHPGVEGHEVYADVLMKLFE